MQEEYKLLEVHPVKSKQEILSTNLTQIAIDLMKEKDNKIAPESNSWTQERIAVFNNAVCMSPVVWLAVELMGYTLEENVLLACNSIFSIMYLTFLLKYNSPDFAFRVNYIVAQMIYSGFSYYSIYFRVPTRMSDSAIILSLMIPCIMFSTIVMSDMKSFWISLLLLMMLSKGYFIYLYVTYHLYSDLIFMVSPGVSSLLQVLYTGVLIFSLFKPSML